MKNAPLSEAARRLWGEDYAPAWTHARAVDLCRLIEEICPAYGCHVALTGGCLHKDGPRKDADILFYRIRQRKTVDKKGLFKALEALGIKQVSGSGWCHKATWNALNIDFLFPEEQDGGDYKK